MGGNKSKTTTQQSTGPWLGQQPYIKTAFSEAENLYNQGKTATPYSGDFVAQPNGQQDASYNGLYNFGMGQGQNAAGSLLNYGGILSQLGLDNTSGAMSGLFGLSGDNTSTIQGNAQSYADSPYVSGMVDSAMRDAVRTASEETLPNLYRSASGSGNLNSDRAALAQGVVERGLAEKSADISADLRGSLYSKGLDLASGDITARMGALQALGGLGAGASGQGAANLQGGVNTGIGALGAAVQGADGQQMLDQNYIDNELAKYEYGQNYGWDNLGKFYSLVGANNWGSETTGTSITKQTPSALSTFGSILGTLGSFAKLSDRSIKTVYGEAGTMRGLKSYVWSYHGSQKLHVGPMAQDVQAQYPDMVVKVGDKLAIDAKFFV